MHEVSIVEGIIESVTQQRSNHNFERIISVEITCGQYNCVDEETLQFCYDIATKGTWLEGAGIMIKRLNEQYQCSVCGKEFFLDGEQKTCSCGSDQLIPQINTDLYVSKLEVA